MAVEELIQDECSPEKIKAAIDELLDDAVRERMTQDYLELVKALGDSGASERTAKAIYANTRTLLSQASDLLD
jgi:lipid A disaccharide synthetase